MSLHRSGASGHGRGGPSRSRRGPRAPTCVPRRAIDYFGGPSKQSGVGPERRRQCGSSPRRAHSGTHRTDVVLHVEREHVTYVGEERRTSTTFALTVLTTGGARHTRWGTGQVPTRSRALEHIRSHSGCPGRCRQNVLWVGTTPYTRCRTHRSEPPSTCDGARRSARTLTSKRSICTCAVGACDWSAQPS